MDNKVIILIIVAIVAVIACLMALHHVSIVEGDNIVIVGTSDSSETAKIASTMKFN